MSFTGIKKAAGERENSVLLLMHHSGAQMMSTQYQSSRRLFNMWVGYCAIIHEEHSWVNAGWSHLLYCE